MNASPFRSHLMQTFAVSARAQSRPPIALFSLGGGGGGGRANVPPAALPPSPSASSSSRHHPRPRGSSSVASRSLPAGGGDSRDAHVCPSEDVVHHEPPPPPSPPPPPPTSAEALRRLIVSRRTVSNFAVRPPSLASSDAEYLRGAISRGVACAASAPNHKVTEPSTFRRILAPSAASERLLVIAHEVTLRRLLDGKLLSGEGACRSEAARKREKWATVPAFVVATAGGMDDQVSSGGAEYDPYGELPHVPPSTIAQLEDHASTCASVQNLLLSLHAEGLGCRWATGPVIRTRSFRDLIDCRRDEMVVALIMVGWAKRLPTSSRRRFRELEGDVLRDVDYDAR